MNKQVFTGDRPTGPLHIGHYFGSLHQRVLLQKTNPIIVIIADTQVLNNQLHKGHAVKENILHLMRSYLAVGLDAEKVTFIQQSEISEIFELTNYLSNFVSLNAIMRNPTIKAENKTYNDNLNMGFLNYPISQTADVALFDGQIIPVGQDQIPILEFSKNVIHKFNQHYNCQILQPFEAIVSNTPKLLGTDGVNKMSKSLNNCINLCDTEKMIKEKINNMYTDKNHIKISDPGQVKDNVVFYYLDIFLEDKNYLQELKEHYTKGGLGDVFLKKLLYTQISNFINPIAQNYYQKTDKDILDILHNGTEKAKIQAKNKMMQIKDIIFK